MGSVAVVTVLIGACIIAQVRRARLRTREMRGKFVSPVTIS
jgi:hypothetical protein